MAALIAADSFCLKWLQTAHPQMVGSLEENKHTLKFTLTHKKCKLGVQTKWCGTTRLQNAVSLNMRILYYIFTFLKEYIQLIYAQGFKFLFTFVFFYQGNDIFSQGRRVCITTAIQTKCETDYQTNKRIYT